MSAGRLLGGRYQVGELLGYGGMAEVHHGRDLRLGRDVAIKLLRADLARDATFQMRFGREAQNAAALNHPAIVAVYDTGEEKGASGESLPYIVMEFVNGRTLKEVLTAEGPLLPRRALEISADVCAALEFSHRHGIIHRDIKPGNVMLTQTGQVKVMDFGIARALASGASTMTQTSAVIGTAQYLSPEQARGEAVDARSDVYATGCVVFELLTGHPPFVGDNPVSVAYQHVREDPKAPSASNRDVTPDVDAIVLKALAKNPLNRYQSAAEMRADLLRAVAGRPVLATPVMRDNPGSVVDTPPRMGPNGARATTPARVGNPQRRRASGWVMVALTLLGILAVVALGTGLYLTSRTQMVTVPDVTGQPSSTAVNVLKQHNLNVSGVNNIKDNTCTVGNVLSTQPAKGEKVGANTPIVVNVCAGPNQVSVPLMVGRTRALATSALASVGLTPDFIQVDGTAAVDTVVSVDPGETKVVNSGSTVKVYLSKGNQAVVPSIQFETPDQAKKDLKAAGFTGPVHTVTQDSVDASQAGHVVNQTPDASTTQLKTVPITIYVGGPFVQPPPSSSPSGTPSGVPTG
jgi:eukaryotic-like serine/threonine-protein kinase